MKSLLKNCKTKTKIRFQTTLHQTGSFKKVLPDKRSLIWEFIIVDELREGSFFPGVGCKLMNVAEKMRLFKFRASNYNKPNTSNNIRPDKKLY